MNSRRAWGLAFLLAALSIVIVRSCRRDAEDPAGEPVVELTIEEQLQRDDRISYLLPPCARPDPFLADTSDMVAVLVSKLGRGQLDPLRQAKSELARMGPAALPELRRFFDSAYVEALSAPLVINALAVAALMESDDGREILLDGLQHPQETVRLAAVRGLRRHAKPQDYDRLIPLMPVSGSELGLAIGQLAVLVDRERFELDLLDWFDEGRFPSLWEELFPLITEAEQPAALKRMSELEGRAEGILWISMQVALAHSGDAAADAKVKSWLADDNAVRRMFAVRALDRAKLTGEVAPLVANDPDVSVREFMARSLSALPPTPEILAQLRVASGDSARGVRLTCLGALVAHGDEAAINEVLEMLRGDKSDLEAAFAILRAGYDKNPGLDERALSVVMRLRAGELQPVRVDRLTLDRALGYVPLRAAAEELYRTALTAQGEIQGIRAHRWYLQQVGNVGEPGRALAREHWDGEPDPLRRMDLVTASSYDAGAGARELLVHVIDSERSTPEEMLYAAHLLLKVGPAETTAPYLKRVTLQVADAKIRSALNCLLWEWYGRDT
jgi:HEAT repeat protein